MADKRSRFGLIDLIAVVVSPVLVMLMVGSLVFFLIEVLYQGNYTGRMLYTMFFFVFAAVLIARLSIQFGRSRASIYMLALGAVTFLALTAFSEYNGLLKLFAPLINLGLMALIWWAADKLTWDCTDFDEARKASGRGVLAAAGLDQNASPTDPEPDPEPEPRVKKKKEKDPFLGWVERFRQYRAEQKKKPHTPGVWVLYFSLAALPLFALGQSLIDPEDAATRRATFLDMAVYVGSGLGLVVTTTLFGLKRYIEERGATVPHIMTASWLVTGGALIVVFVGVGALLPRPHSETAWFGMDRKGDKAKRQASKNAVIKDSSAGEGEGAEGKKTEAGDGKGSAKGGKEGGKSGEKGSGGGKGKSDGGKQQDGKSGNSNAKNAGKQGKDQKGDPSKSQSKDKKNDKDQGGSNASNEDKSDNEQSEGGDDAQDSEKKSDSDSDSATSKISQMFESIGDFVKWIVWIIIAVAVVIGVVVFFLKWLAPFTNWAKNLLDWLKGLFVRKPRVQTAKEEEAAVREVVRRTPFAAFDNPFRDGTARRPPAELVEYTFAAFDAWAWDRDRGREPGETPLEFAIRIGHEWAELDEPAFQMANLYVRVLYSRSPLPGDTLKVLAALWEQLDAAAVRA